jgi:hypothetical protein
LTLVKRFKVPLILAVLVLIPLWDLLWLPSGQSIAGNDIRFMFLQWWRFSLDALRQGELPLWNPYLFSGVPFLANPQPALFYPPLWLLTLFPATRVAGLLFYLHLWLAGVGMYAWLRSEGADEVGALFGGGIFAFNGYFFVRMFGGHLGVVMTQAWLPALLWAYRRALNRNRLSAAVLGGLFAALSLLAGHTASFLYVGLALGAYALYCTWEAWERGETPLVALRPLLLGGVMVLVGLGLAAVQLLATWEFLGLSTRQAATYAFAADNSWPPGYLLTLFIPNFFGELARTGYWGDGIYTELVFYTGILPLFLVLALGFHRRARHRLIPFLLVLGGVGLLLALGQFGFLHRLAYNFVPFFRATRVPARAGFLFTFAVAASAGLLLTWLRREPEVARPGLRGWVQGPLLWLVIALTVLVILAGYLLFALERDSNPEAGRLWHVANHSALFLLLFLLTVGLMRAWQSGRINARQGGWLAIGLVLLDLWGFGRSLVQPTSVEESAYWRIVAEVTQAPLSETADGAGRVLPWGLSIFEHNQGMAFDLQSVFGYDPLELEHYARFTTAVPDPRARAYDLLGARYLITTQEMSFPAEPDAPRLLEQRDGVWIYERPTALPPAWLVHQVEVHPQTVLLERLNSPDLDPRSTVLLEQSPPCQLDVPAGPEHVRFSRRGNNQLEIQVRASSASVLVMGEVFYPGWQARLDGQPVPLLRADYALRAVCVPAGEHRITLKFAPSSLRIGAGITLFFLLLVGWAVWNEATNLASKPDS